MTSDNLDWLLLDITVALCIGNRLISTSKQVDQLSVK